MYLHVHDISRIEFLVGVALFRIENHYIFYDALIP